VSQQHKKVSSAQVKSRVPGPAEERVCAQKVYFSWHHALKIHFLEFENP
jgi:hypothetical protein